MSAQPHDEGPLPISPRVLTALRVLLAALSALMVALFVYTALRRMHFAYEYDWIEDGMLASVRHLRSGLPLYSAPTTAFTPYLYTPIYLHAAAALSRLTGLGYAPLRLLSLLSTLGCCAVIYLLVYRETNEILERLARRHLAALAAVGLFAACYPVVQGAFDLGRVDMLYLFFVLLAFYVTRFGHPALAALLWVLAFQTKQGVLPVALLALCYDWQRPRRVLLGVGSFAVALAGSILWLNHATQGWYRYYVFGLASGFGWSKAQATHFITGDLLGACGIAVLIIAAARLAAPASFRSRGFSFYALGSVGMIVFTGYIRAHRGANVNSLLPMYVWIAVLFGLALARLFAVLEARDSAASRGALAVLLLAASVQLVAHLYSPGEYLPTPGELAEREAFEQQLRAIPGNVLVMSHPEDGLLAGEPLFAGSESIGAVIDAHDRDQSAALRAQYAELLHSGALSAVVLDMTAEEIFAIRDQGHRVWMPPDFLTLYPLRVSAIGGGDTRFTSEPRWIYLPCSQQAAALRLDAHADTSPCSGR
jgi:hypothetical protein